MPYTNFDKVGPKLKALMAATQAAIKPKPHGASPLRPRW